MPSTTSDKKPEPDYRHHPRLPLSTTGLAGRLRRGRCLDAVPHLRRPAPPVAQADLVGCVTRCPRDRGRSRPDARCTRCAAGGQPHFMDRHFRDQCGHAIGFRVEGGGASLADHRLAGGQERHRFPAPGQPRARPDHQRAGRRHSWPGQACCCFSGRNDDRWLQFAAFSCRVVATGTGGRAAGVAGGNFLLGTGWAAQSGATL